MPVMVLNEISNITNQDDYKKAVASIKYGEIHICMNNNNKSKFQA
jgi:hypothetical protein